MLREEILLSEVERDVLSKLHEMLHLAESSAAQYIDPGVFDHHYKAARKHYHSFSRLMYPFGTDERSVEQSVVEELTRIWKQEFGDPDDPEVQKSIQRAREYISSNKVADHA